MDKLLILNGSPRALRSNSQKFIEMMTPHLGCEWEECFLFTQNHREICDKVKEYSDVLFVFPLYVDSLPCCVLEFLDCLCQNLPDSRPTVHLMINCGFLETEQNSIAIKTLQFFCKKYGFPFGSCLSIGSGEAILTSPFDMLFKLNLKKLAKSIKNSAPLTLSIALPISKERFVAESEKFWLRAGEKNGITKEQMQSPNIE